MKLKAYCSKHHLSLYDYVLTFEGLEIVDFLKDIWNAMKDAIQRGITIDGTLPGPLKGKKKS